VPFLPSGGKKTAADRLTGIDDASAAEVLVGAQVRSRARCPLGEREYFDEI